MPLEIRINNSTSPRANYVGWSPSPCKLISTELVSRTVYLRNLSTTRGGQLVFSVKPTGPFTSSIKLVVGAGKTVSFYVAGRFDAATGKGYPSIQDGDAVIAARYTSASITAPVARKALMVRVRKDANKLTPAERDRFLAALMRLNATGGFGVFQNRHTDLTSREIHGRECFLPWHRAFLLDLERKLQDIDPSVALPYWRFDKPAPNVFKQDFMGLATDASGLIQFTATNPLINWRITLPGTGPGSRVRRVAAFATATSAANIANDEAETLALGANFSSFRGMEGDPHGSAHTSFSGQLSAIGLAPADPLFFLLHCNIDRLWAKWQWTNAAIRFNPTNSIAYNKQGSAPTPHTSGTNGVGNYTNDTMWPWNGVITPPRPATAPGGDFPGSAVLAVPGIRPTVKSMIDYHGRVSLAANLGFWYDDVPY